MKINLDTVPSTIAEAVEALVDALEPVEWQTILFSPPEQLCAHHTVGQFLRNNWSLWERETPLKQDAVTQYGIAHADDISNLIINWAMALVRSEPFDPLAYCERYHEHWAKFGTTSLAAGGWPPPGNPPLTERRG